MRNSRPKSKTLQSRASQVMPQGGSSNSRYWGEGKNLYVERAKGAHVWDVDGNRYIDYRLAFGPVILGYAYDQVDARVYAAIQNGVTIGLTKEIEISAAEKVISMVPGIDLVRFVNSGTEATMHTLRLARAYTGKEKYIKFEGGYHGSHDYVLFSTYSPPGVYGSHRDPIPVPASSGIPSTLNDLVITLPFNDPDAVEKALKRAGHEVAAILTEPMLGNFGSVDPAPGYLNFLREKCNQYDTLLIFDEVKTGFRIAPGGAPEYYGVIPDLIAYAKAIGNGYPVAAFAGKSEVMSMIGKGVSQGGTYSGNAIGAAAVDATLEVIRSQPVNETIRKLGCKLQDGLRQIFEAAGVQVSLSQHPSIFSVSFGVDQVNDARDWATSDQAFYKRLGDALLERGVLIDIDPREPWCLCYSHSEEDIHETLNAVEDSLRTIKR